MRHLLNLVQLTGDRIYEASCRVRMSCLCLCLVEIVIAEIGVDPFVTIANFTQHRTGPSDVRFDAGQFLSPLTYVVLLGLFCGSPGDF